LRLARFNVNRDLPPPSGKPHFIGVPAPGGALLALLPIFASQVGLFDAASYPLPCGLYLALVGLLMASRVPTPSSKALRIPRDKAAFALVGLAFVVGMAVARFWLLMFTVTTLYAIVIAVAVLRHAVRRPR
jgi:CDP-diacylglycerol--serine O-phosphatidyltransferase